MSEDYFLSFKNESNSEQENLLNQNLDHDQQTTGSTCDFFDDQIKRNKAIAGKNHLDNKRKVIKKSQQSNISSKKRRVKGQNTLQIEKNGDFSFISNDEDQNELVQYLSKQNSKQIYQLETQDNKQQILTCLFGSLLQYQIKSSNKFFLSSSKVISMDWFTKDPYSVYDMELYSEFMPVERVIYHKKHRVVELSQLIQHHSSENLNCLIQCLNSISSQNAHLLACLLSESQRRIQMKNQSFNQSTSFMNNILLNELPEIKKRAFEIIDQQDPQKIFSFNIFIHDPIDSQYKKISQGYSDGFLKMMGVNHNSFSSFVMKHKGFEAFSGKARLDTLMMVLFHELGEKPNTYNIDKTAYVKTFDDYIVKLTPVMKFFPLNEQNTAQIIINYFDADVDQLIRLENIRKREQLPNFQHDFRYQCQAQNLVEKFYPNEEHTNKQEN